LKPSASLCHSRQRNRCSISLWGQFRQRCDTRKRMKTSHVVTTYGLWKN